MLSPNAFRPRRNERRQGRQLHRKVEKSKYFSSSTLLAMVAAFFVGLYVIVAIATLVNGSVDHPRRLGKDPLVLLNRPRSITIQLEETLDSTTKDKKQGISNGGRNFRGNNDDEEQDLEDVDQDDQGDAENETEGTDDDESEKANNKADDDKESVDSEAMDEEGDDESETDEPKDWNDDNTELNRLWFGRPSSSIESSLNFHDIKISIVMSYCHGDLHWLSSYLGGIKFQRFTVISKCGKQPKIDQFPKGVEFIELTNVGRCDHNMAHWIAEVLSVEKDVDENEIIVFLKDNIIVHQEGSYRDLATILATTVSYGLGCGMEPKHGISVFHATDELIKFSLDHYYGADGTMTDEPVRFKSKYTDMGEWHVDMGISLPKPVVPVCYGGVFAVKRSQISKVPRTIWQNMERSLARGDNIEEGHFAERTWSGLLHRPLTDEEVQLLQGRSQKVYSFTNAMFGSLMKG